MLAQMSKVELTDERWRRLEPLVPPLRRYRGRPSVDGHDRMFAFLGSLHPLLVPHGRYPSIFRGFFLVAYFILLRRF
jgi:transposase